jgi:hypothetical protein
MDWPEEKGGKFIAFLGVGPMHSLAVGALWRDYRCQGHTPPMITSPGSLLRVVLKSGE